MKIKKTVLLIVFGLIALYTPGRFFSQSGSDNSNYSLQQNSPNPFGETTTIKFFLKEDCFVKLYVISKHMGEIYMLAEGDMTSGEHGIVFKAALIGSGSVGINEGYICTLETYSGNGEMLYSSQIEMIQQ